MKNLCLIIIVAFNLTSNKINAQPFTRALNIPVTINGNQLVNPWAGGLNYPQFSAIDLNSDGIKDLFVFELLSNKILTFINNGTPNQVDYHFAPQYISMFPPMQGWAMLVDYNCDGKEDIFTYGNAAIKVYRNISGASALQFVLQTNQINTMYGTISSNLYVNSVSIPGLADIDGDGDLDVLSFPVNGAGIEFHKNYSEELYGTCDSLIFHLDTAGWGGASIQRLSKLQVNPYGKNLLATDNDGDGDIDLITDLGLSQLSDKTHLNYYENTGDTSNAVLVLVDDSFPSYSVPAYVYSAYPSAFYLDINNDNKKDMIVAPGPNNINTQDIKNVLYYQNTASSGTNNFNFIKNDLLVGDMIDVGTRSKVCFFDVDNDGLKDLIIGNDSRTEANGNITSSLYYYRNTGTATNPAFQFITDNFSNTASLSLLGLSPTFGDLDGDGDDDMLIGNKDGTILIYTNTAGAGNPANFTFSQGSYMGIDVGNNAAPQLMDVDRDGLPDLVIGERNGNLNYYRNTGTVSTPVFSSLTNGNFGGVNVVKSNALVGNSSPFLFDNNGSYELLVGSESGYIYHYNSIDGNLAGNFTLLDSAYENIFEPMSATLSGADINGDGLMDIAVGNYSGGLIIYSQSAIGVNEIAAGSLQLTIIPNPVKDIVELKMPNGELSNATLTLYDITGRVMLQQTFIAFRNIGTHLNLSTLSSGVYIAEVKDKEGRSVKGKLVKE